MEFNHIQTKTKCTSVDFRDSIFAANKPLWTLIVSLWRTFCLFHSFAKVHREYFSKCYCYCRLSLRLRPFLNITEAYGNSILVHSARSSLQSSRNLRIRRALEKKTFRFKFSNQPVLLRFSLLPILILSNEIHRSVWNLCINKTFISE